MANHNGRTSVTLRLPKELLAKIDAIRSAQPVSVSRNIWIAEAVVRRVEAEKPDEEKRDVSQ